MQATPKTDYKISIQYSKYNKTTKPQDRTKYNTADKAMGHKIKAQQ